MFCGRKLQHIIFHKKLSAKFLCKNKFILISNSIQEIRLSLPLIIGYQQNVYYVRPQRFASVISLNHIALLCLLLTYQLVKCTSI